MAEHGRDNRTGLILMNRSSAQTARLAV